ncbi:MAG: hypothetical protein ACK56I_20870, partial [bacterium]
MGNLLAERPLLRQQLLDRATGGIELALRRGEIDLEPFVLCAQLRRVGIVICQIYVDCSNELF